MEFLFTTVTNSLWLILSFSILIIVCWYLFLNKSISIDEIQDNMNSSIASIFDDPSRRPLYKVFYCLHHPSVESWLRWIKTQSITKQERAFRRLANYLQEVPKELGSISQEVVKAVILYQHPESFAILATLLMNSRNKWAQYIALNLFYESVAIGLIELNPQEAQAILLNELRAAIEMPNSDKIKSYILNALNKLESEVEKLAIFESIINDTTFGIQTRTQALNFIEKIGEDTLFQSLQQSLLKLLNNQKEDEIFPIFFSRVFELMNETKREDMAWDLIEQASKSKMYSGQMIKLLNEQINNAKFIINGAAILRILDSLDQSNQAKLKPSLEQRHALNKNECNLIQIADQVCDLDSLSTIPEEALYIDQVEIKIDLPDVHHHNYEKLKKTIESKNNQGMILATGDTENDKFLLSRFIAKSTNKTFIAINTEHMLLSPEQIDHLSEEINKNKPCIVYLNNSVNFLNSMLLENKRRVIKLADTLKKYNTDPRVTVIVSVNIDSIDLMDRKDPLAEFINNIPNQEFSTLINIGSFSAREKQRIYNQYELNLNDEREVAIQDISEILNTTKGFSNTKYLSFLLKYMKSSLLSHGKFISIEEYQKLSAA